MAEPINNTKFEADLVDSENLPEQVGSYDVNTNGGDKILISVDNSYLGYVKAFRTDIPNIWTIVARLGNLKVKAHGLADADVSEVAMDMISIAVLIDYEQYKLETANDDILNSVQW